MSKIEWTDATWNPWQGCTKVSQGCKNCYMYRDKKRYGQEPATVVQSATATFNKPLKWKNPMRVFTCSWSDFFIPEADPWRDEAWKIIRKTPHITYQILTKRPMGIPQRLPLDWDYGKNYPNVWLGVSVESEDLLSRVGWLSYIPAKVRFVSYEPALGPVSFKKPLKHGFIDWIIAGGESGSNFRPVQTDWFRQVRDDCQEAGVPFFFKQWGGTKKINGTWGGRELDGKIWNEFPEGVKNENSR